MSKRSFGGDDFSSEVSRRWKDIKERAGEEVKEKMVILAENERRIERQRRSFRKKLRGQRRINRRRKSISREKKGRRRRGLSPGVGGASLGVCVVPGG